MTTNEMLNAIESFRGMKRGFYESNPEGEPFSADEIEFAKQIARILDDGQHWHVAPVNGGGILFENETMMIEVTEVKV